MFSKNNKEATPEEEKTEKLPQRLAMVPLFSRRTIIMAAIGVVVGALLGLLYYILAPSLSSSGANLGEEPQAPSGGFLSSFGPAASGPWQSEVNVEILNPGLTTFQVSALHGQGMEAWVNWLTARLP